MAVLREAWESGKSQDVSVVAHVVQIREQLQQMTDLVEQNMEKAQANQRSGMIGMPEVANLSQETKYLCCYLRQPASCLHSGRVHMK